MKTEPKTKFEKKFEFCIKKKNRRQKFLSLFGLACKKRKGNFVDQKELKKKRLLSEKNGK